MSSTISTISVKLSNKFELRVNDKETQQKVKSKLGLDKEDPLTPEALKRHISANGDLKGLLELGIKAYTDEREIAEDEKEALSTDLEAFKLQLQAEAQSNAGRARVESEDPILPTEGQEGADVSASSSGLTLEQKLDEKLKSKDLTEIRLEIGNGEETAVLDDKAFNSKPESCRILNEGSNDDKVTVRIDDATGKLKVKLSQDLQEGESIAIRFAGLSKEGEKIEGAKLIITQKKAKTVSDTPPPSETPTQKISRLKAEALGKAQVAEISLKKDKETKILDNFTGDLPSADGITFRKESNSLYATLTKDVEEGKSINFDAVHEEGDEKYIGFKFKVTQDKGGWTGLIVKSLLIGLGAIGALIGGSSSEGGKGWLGVLGGALATIGALTFEPIRNIVFGWLGGEDKKPNS